MTTRNNQKRRDGQTPQKRQDTKYHNTQRKGATSEFD